MKMRSITSLLHVHRHSSTSRNVEEIYISKICTIKNLTFFYRKKSKILDVKSIKKYFILLLSKCFYQNHINHWIYLKNFLELFIILNIKISISKMDLKEYKIEVSN